MDENRRSAKRYSGKSAQKSNRSGSSQLEPSSAPEDLAEYILKVLARDQDSLQFERQAINPTRSRLNVTCDPAFMGRLIGRDGKTISALRLLIRAAGSRCGKRVDIEIA
jgi:predicted RNA-binding protein YlqC (UPF0109 family)